MKKQMLIGALMAVLSCGALACSDNNDTSNNANNTNNTNNANNQKDMVSGDMTTDDMTKDDMSKQDMAKEDMAKEDMSKTDMSDDMSGGDMGGDMNACAITPTPKMPINACGDRGLNGCFANSDCADDERCENLAPENENEVACCVKGPRGCKSTGEKCLGENGDLTCDEGLCVARNDGDPYCTQRCNSDNDCPESLPECQPVLGVCVEAAN